MGLCNSMLDNEEYGYGMNGKDQYLDVSFKKGWYRTTVPVVVREKPDCESPIIQHIKKGARIEMIAFTNWFVKIASPVHGYIQFVTVEECPKQLASGGGRGVGKDAGGRTEIIVQPGRLGLYFTNISDGSLGDLNPDPQEILKIVGVSSGWRLVEVEGHPFGMDILKQYIDGKDPYHLAFERDGFADSSFGDIRLAASESPELELVETSIHTIESNRIESSAKPVEVVGDVARTPRNSSNNHNSNSMPKKRTSIDEEILVEPELNSILKKKEKQLASPVRTRERNLSEVKRMVNDYEHRISNADFVVSEGKRTIEHPTSGKDEEEKKRDPSSVVEFEKDDFITIASEKTTTTVTTTITTTTKEHKKQQQQKGGDNNVALEETSMTTVEPPVTTISKEKKTLKEVLPPPPPSATTSETKTKPKKSQDISKMTKSVSEPPRERKRSRRSLSKKRKPAPERVLVESRTWPNGTEGEESMEGIEGPLGPIELGEPIPDTLSLYQIRRMKKVGRLLGDGFEPKRTHKRQVSETLQLLQQTGSPVVIS